MIKRLRRWPWQRVLTLGLTLRARILVGTLLPLAAIALYFAYNIRAQRALAQTTHEILDNRMEMMGAAERIRQALVAYDDAVFRYLAIQDPDQLSEEVRRKKETEENLANLRRLASSNVLRARLDLLQTESDQYFVDAERLLDYAKNTGTSLTILRQRSSTFTRQNNKEHLELAFLSGEGKTRLIRVYSLCEEILTVNRLELERAQAEMGEVLVDARRTAIALSILCGALLILVAFGFILSLLSPLRNLLQGIRLMQEGDLSLEIPVTTDDEVGELTQAFNQAARTIRGQREQLLKETITDGLTGAYNQRHFRTLLRQEVERAHRSGEPLSLLMIDVDHFKEYNDTFGHEFGNEVLKKVSELIRETVREIDVIARYGGDEFAVILPQADFASAKILARRILDTVAAYGFLATHRQEKSPKLAISIGGSSYPEDGPSAEALIHQADIALYKAKEAGRGRVQWTEPPPNRAEPLEEARHKV